MTLKTPSSEKSISLREQKSLTSGADSSSSSGVTSMNKQQERIEKLLGSLKHTSEILEDVLKDIYQRGNVPAHPTGLRDIDNVTWGIHKKELMIIGGRTSEGKSSLAMQFALNLADQGARIGYFSLEMSREQLMERMISNISEIDNRLLRCGMAKEKVRQSEKFLREFIPNLKICYDDESGYTFDNIVTICDELKFDFVFIDYIQMISSRGYKSKLEAIDEYIRKFKEICKTMNFGGVIVSQINRQGVGEDMGLHHLKGSGTIEEHPDTVLLLEWDREEDEYTVRVAKQRHGEVKDVMIEYRPQFFKFTDYMGKVSIKEDKKRKQRADVW